MGRDVAELKTGSEQQSALPLNAYHDTEASATLASVLAQFSEQIYSLPNVDGGAINLINESNDALVTAHLKLPQEFGGIQDGYKGFQIRFDQSDIYIRVFRQSAHEIVTESNLEKYAEITKIRFQRWKMRSLLVFPLFATQDDGTLQVIGAASVFSRNAYLEDSLATQLETIASPYMAQVQMLWTEHQIIERTKIAEAMSDNVQRFFSCVTEMNRLTTVKGVYALIAKEFAEQFHFDSVSILMAEHGELTLVETAFSEPFKHLSERHSEFSKNTKYLCNATDGQCGFVYVQNQHFHIDDVARIVHLPMSEKDRGYLDCLESVRTLLMVPIRLEKTVVGILALATLAQVRPLSETDLKLIEMLASFSSTAIRNAKAHELVAQKSSEIELLNQDLKIQMVLLDHVARKDRLTGLNNFGNFEEELKRRTSEYARKDDGNSLAVILFDVDHFKLFNDTYGHLAGNQILQEVGNRILKCAREMDFVARYGGEEFAMLLPQCDLAGASVIADRIRCKIAEEEFVVDGKPHNISVSGGCAQFAPTESAHNFIFRVDAALYSAKRNGRNRIEKAFYSLSQVS